MHVWWILKKDVFLVTGDVKLDGIVCLSPDSWEGFVPTTPMCEGNPEIQWIKYSYALWYLLDYLPDKSVLNTSVELWNPFLWMLL